MNRQNILLFRGTRAASLAIKRRMLIFLYNFFSCSPNFRPIEMVREAFLRIGGIAFRSKLSVGDNFFYLNGRNLRFGNDCTLGHFCHFYDWFPINVGDRLFCSNQLTVVSASHDPITYESTAGPVNIGNNVWIGINVTVVGPVTIGDNVVIGAGSVVLKDIPSNAIAAGVPAKVIRFKSQLPISND